MDDYRVSIGQFLTSVKEEEVIRNKDNDRDECGLTGSFFETLIRIVVTRNWSLVVLVWRSICSTQIMSNVVSSCVLYPLVPHRVILSQIFLDHILNPNPLPDSFAQTRSNL